MLCQKAHVPVDARDSCLLHNILMQQFSSWSTPILSYKVFFVMQGDCAMLRSAANASVYHNVALSSGGQVYVTRQRSSAQKMLRILLELLMGGKLDTLLFTKLNGSRQTNGANKQHHFQLTVDQTVTRLFVGVSCHGRGMEPHVKVRSQYIVQTLPTIQTS